MTELTNEVTDEILKDTLWENTGVVIQTNLTERDDSIRGRGLVTGVNSYMSMLSGAAKPVNWATLRDVYYKEPVVNQGINTVNGAVFQPGFKLEIIEENEKTRNKIIDNLKQWRLKLGFDSLIQDYALEGKIIGNLFVEEVTADSHGKGELLNLVMLPSETMEVDLDAKGRVRQYIQRPVDSDQDVISFPPEEVHHYKLFPGADPYGHGLIEPCMESIKCKLDTIYDSRKVMHRYGSPIKLWTFGVENRYGSPFPFPKEMIKGFMSDLESIAPRFDVGAPLGVDCKLIGTGEKVGMNFKEYLEYYDEQIYSSITKMSYRKKNEFELEVFDKYVQSLQHIIADELIIPLIRKYLLGTEFADYAYKVRVHWKRIERMQRSQMIPNYVKLADSGILVPNEIRESLGYFKPLEGGDKPTPRQSADKMSPFKPSPSGQPAKPKPKTKPKGESEQWYTK